MSEYPSYHRPRPRQSRSFLYAIATVIIGAWPAVKGVASVVDRAKAWVDARWVPRDVYVAEKAARRERYVADSVHHAIDDRANARVKYAVDSIEKAHQKSERARVLQAGEPRP